MGIRNFLDRIAAKKQMYEDYSQQMKVQEKYLERKKSANERELERYMDEQREKEIKMQLEKLRKINAKEINYGHQILRTKNMFNGDKHQLLKNKKMSHKYHMHEAGGLFFK